MDGLQIGGTQTATVLQSNGSRQTFDVEGNFGAGPHSVVVDFLNDAYGDSLPADRNLYVDGMSFDGTAVSGGALVLFGPGPQSLSFNGGQAGGADSPDKSVFG